MYYLSILNLMYNTAPCNWKTLKWGKLRCNKLLLLLLLSDRIKDSKKYRSLIILALIKQSLLKKIHLLSGLKPGSTTLLAAIK